MPAEKQFALGATTQFVDMLVSSATSKGAFSVFVSHVDPGDGPPPHQHIGEDEFFLPLEGEFEVFDGAAWHPIDTAGVWAPRDKVHTWRNSGSTRGKLLGVATGASFDVFLEKFSRLRIPEQMDEVISMSAEHGISYVLPPQAKAESQQAELAAA